jgi:hypothetical protein
LEEDVGDVADNGQDCLDYHQFEGQIFAGLDSLGREGFDRVSSEDDAGNENSYYQGHV